MTRAEEKKLCAAIRMCNMYTNALGDIIDTGRKNSALYKRALNAESRLSRLVRCEESIGMAEDPLYELSATIHEYETRIAAR